MMIPGKPFVPRRFDPLDLGHVTGIGPVIDIEPWNLVETDHPVKFFLRDESGQLLQKMIVPPFVGETVTTEKVNLNIARMFSLPGSSQNRDVMSPRGTTF